MTRSFFGLGDVGFFHWRLVSGWYSKAHDSPPVLTFQDTRRCPDAIARVGPFGHPSAVLEPSSARPSFPSVQIFSENLPDCSDSCPAHAPSVEQSGADRLHHLPAAIDVVEDLPLLESTFKCSRLPFSLSHHHNERRLKTPHHSQFSPTVPQISSSFIAHCLMT